MNRIVACVVSFTMFAMVGCMSADVDGINENEVADPTIEELGIDQQDVAAVRGAEHCVVDTASESIDDKGARVVRLPTRATQCFPTFSQAIEFATDGRVRLAPSATLNDADKELAALPNLPGATSYVIGIDYKDINFEGASLTRSSPYTCPGRTHWTDTMPIGWDNVISSAKAFSGCNNSYHYENAYGKGAVRDCGTTCSNIGDAMNDRTSSIRWIP